MNDNDIKKLIKEKVEAEGGFDKMVKKYIDNEFADILEKELKEYKDE